MLSNTSFNEATGIASLLTANSEQEQGITLTPKEATPLKALYLATQSRKAVPDYAVDSLIENTIGSDGMESIHDSTMAISVEQYSAGLYKAHSLARNVANPLINDFYTQSLELSKQYSERSHGNKYYVTVVATPEIFTNVFLDGVLDSAGSVPGGEVELFKLIENLGENELSDLVLTGINSIDTDVNAWLSTLRQGDLNYFLDEVKRVNDATKVTDENIALFAYLIANTLSNGIPNGLLIAGNGDHTAFYDQARRAKFVYGKVLNTARKRLIRRSNSHALVKELRDGVDGKIEILVFDRNFRKFCKDGGSADLLAASYEVGMGASIADKLLGMSKEIGSKYETLQKARKQSMVNSEASALETSLASVLTNYINELESSANKHVMVREWMATNRYVAGSDFLEHVTDLVCDVFFKGTDAKLIIKQMRAIKKTQPDLDGREIASLVIIEMVADWLVSQIEVTIE